MVDKFFTTRPRLASYLQSVGYEPQKVANPYDPKRPAWTFKASLDLAKSVRDYCYRNQIDHPKQLAAYYEQIQREEAARWDDESKMIREQKRRFYGFLKAMERQYPKDARDRDAWEEDKFGLFYSVLRDNEDFCDYTEGPEYKTDNKAYADYISRVWDEYTDHQ